MAVITPRIVAPLAAKGGTIKVASLKFTQIDIKNAWDNGAGGTPQRVRSPILCSECESEHHYVVGDSKPLRLGPVPEEISND